MKRITLLMLLMYVCFTSASFAQTLYHTYYDYEKTHVQEEYYANSYGVKNGLYKAFSEYGGVIIQGNYKNDKKVGYWVTKNEKGQLVEEVHYNNDEQWNGQRKIYDEDGHLKEEANYKDGQPDGQDKKYVNGNLYAQENYKNGSKFGHWKTWYLGWDGKGYSADNGMYLKADGTPQLWHDEYYKPCPKRYDHAEGMIDWALDSIRTEYNLQGVLISKINYKLGLKNGKAIYYDEDGSGELMGEENYQNDSICGERKIFFDNDGNVTRKKSVATYYRINNCGKNNSIIQGTDYYISGEKMSDERFNSVGYTGGYVEYYKSGILKIKGQYNNNGKRDSIWNWFSVTGKDSVSYRYINGVLSTPVQEKAELEKHRQDSVTAVANKKQQGLSQLEKHRQDSVTAVANKKQQGLSQLEKHRQDSVTVIANKNKQELSYQPHKIDSLYKVFTGVYTGSKKSMFFLDPKTHQPLVNETYPKGKHLYQKADILYNSWNNEYKTLADLDAKVNKGRKIIVLLTRLDGMASTDTDDLDKQMKKADTNEDIEKVLGL